MKYLFALTLLLMVLMACFSPIIAKPGHQTSSSTIRKAKTGGAAAHQAAKATREQRRIAGVDKGK